MEPELPEQLLPCPLCRAPTPHARTRLPGRNAVLLCCQNCGLELYRHPVHLAGGPCGPEPAGPVSDQAGGVDCPAGLAAAVAELAARARPDWRPQASLAEDFYALAG